MRNAWIIYQKELKSYFSSPIAYGIIAFSALLYGYFFYLATIDFLRASFDQFAARGPLNVNDMLIRPTLMNVSIIGVFIIPAITMRLFAEEKRSGTFELLATSPIRDYEMVLGKWFAALTLYAAVLAVSFIDIGLLFLYGKPDLLPVLVGFLGLLLQGGALLAIGTFISTTSRNQVIAAVGTFAMCLMLWVIGWLNEFSTSVLGKGLSYASVIQHLEPFTKGVIDTRDLVYFVSVIFLGLFLTNRSLESVRWRA